jgi:uncharacterized protein with von Willebrand factor type A (vWA) domain
MVIAIIIHSCPEIRRPGEFLSTLRRSKFAFAPKTLAFCCALVRKRLRRRAGFAYGSRTAAAASMPRG